MMKTSERIAELLETEAAGREADALARVEAFLGRRLDELEAKIEGALPEPLMDVKTIATHCGVSEKTVRTWIAEGKLPAFRLGGGNAIRVKRCDLEAFIERERAA